MSADTEMPDEIWAWPKSEYRWSETWIEQETSGATRYIRADMMARRLPSPPDDPDGLIGSWGKPYRAIATPTETI